MPYVRYRHRSGRQLEVPEPATALLQLDLLHDHLSRLEVHPSAHGYTRGCSVETALAPHVGCKYLMHLDIVEFFHSCRTGQALVGLEANGLSPAEAMAVIKVCFDGNRLPVGSPTSPCMSNICCIVLDETLSRLATYTRYSDQLIFSSAAPLDEGLARECIRSWGFRVNESKSWLRVRGRQSLTLMGYTIGGNSLTIPRSARRDLRAMHHLK